jgi:hypothetical protein
LSNPEFNTSSLSSVNGHMINRNLQLKFYAHLYADGGNQVDFEVVEKVPDKINLRLSTAYRFSIEYSLSCPSI